MRSAALILLAFAAACGGQVQSEDGTTVADLIRAGWQPTDDPRPYCHWHQFTPRTPIDPNATNCTLIVPRNPLSAWGLATPYQLVGCDEANNAQAAFVQAAVLDPASGQISVYNPLVINAGTYPAARPVVPTLPANAVVAIWFGFNGSTLTLQGAWGDSTTLSNAKCVNGLPGDPFGQVAYCNAPAFFAAANALQAQGKLTPAPPPLGTGADGQVCPTVRSFFTVDQDPSDNVTTTYLKTSTGQFAQNTVKNAAAFPGSTTIANGSDNRLLAVKLDGILGCTPYKAPDLADPGSMITAQPLNEISAAVNQSAPIALVPLNDPMTLVNGSPSLAKLNLYRAGVNQPAATSLDQAKAEQQTWCQNLLAIQPARMSLNQSRLALSTSPDTAAATNLFTFMAQRFDFTWGADGLGCDALTGQTSPIAITTDTNGVTTGATIAAPGATQ